ncbi:hypothetical protein HDR59_04685 [bacterium]|nr:hypothetical protein [bacterium]
MIKYILCFISVITFGSFFQNEIVNGAVNKKRANTTTKASTKRAAVSSSSSKRAAVSSGSSKNSKNSKSSKTTTTKKSSSSKSGESSVLKCLQEKMPEILDGACSFLLDSNIKEALGDENLWCVYNYKDVGKISSIYNYYLGAYYGITQNTIKSDTSIVNVKNSSKNALKYYEYLIDEINNGTLKESKILDSVRSAVLDKADLDISVESTIENKSIETVPISINIVASDIEGCTKLTKAAMSSCGAVGNSDAKSKITESCTAYNAALIKLAGAKKAEALGYDTEIINALKQRVNAGFYDYKDMVNLEKEKLELEKEYSSITKEKAFIDNQNKRAETAEKITVLQEEIKTISDEDLKKLKQDQLDKLKVTICSLEKLLKNYDKDYEAPDELTKDCTTNSSSSSATSDSSSSDTSDSSK